MDASVEVPFALTCDCGETLRGIRRTRGIQKQCDQCGETLFVLPMNVYPATKSVESEVIGGGFRDRLKVVVSEIFPSKTKTQPTASVASVTQPDVSAIANSANLPTEVAAKKPKVKLPKIPRIDIRKVVRRTFTPFRLVILAMVLVVGFTGYWLTRQQAAEAARQAWLEATDDIQLLLDEGKIVELETLLKETVAAGRTLGKNDSEWRMTFNLYQETRAVNSLAASDLLSAFHAAYDEKGVMVDSAQQNITEASASGTFVIDSLIKLDVGNEGSYLVEVPAAPGNQFVAGVIKLPQLAKFLEAVPDGRVLFAARIESIIPPDRKQQLAWRIEFDPQTFVLFTSPVMCEQVGLPVEFDAQLAAVLQQQQQFVKDTESWETRGDDVVPEQSEASSVLEYL